jgi:hypothetical protein
MNTQTTYVKLRNKLTGFFYADGRCFTANEHDATRIEKDSVSHRFVRFVFATDKHDNVEEVAAQ